MIKSCIKIFVFTKNQIHTALKNILNCIKYDIDKFLWALLIFIPVAPR